MKVGSIVVIKKFPPDLGPFAGHIMWLPIQDEETHYMVRSYASAGVALEEGIIGYYEGCELHIDSEYVREVLPPEDLAEFIEECCCVPMEKY